MFESKHYVPILKWKAAEQLALKNLSEESKIHITPVIQLVMPRPKKKLKENGETKSPTELLEESITTFRTKLTEIALDIQATWGSSPAFIDVSLIDSSLRQATLETILESAHDIDSFLIPMVSPHYAPEMLNSACQIAKKFEFGIALRLSPYDFQDKSTINKNLNEFLRINGLKEGVVDLFIDFSITAENSLHLNDITRKIPNLSHWRTLTFASGSFPVDLTKCKIDEENLIPRSDWKNWLSQLETQEIVRMPSFSDYTIQHPVYKEQLQFFSPSASIKYTLNNEWLIMRGQKGKNFQYLLNAQVLVTDPRFFGERFSFGDNYIVEKSKENPLKGKPGNATNWLVAGINHHLECTAAQIASLA
ncbi:MAG: hypothetical protein HGA33_00960 [Candidatus Moranbacteria bacterium]|nr:hypothetical protein [Candidatus Moranbacteria bacterium]